MRPQVPRTGEACAQRRYDYEYNDIQPNGTRHINKKNTTFSLMALETDTDMLSVVMLNVIMVNVVAPAQQPICLPQKFEKEISAKIRGCVTRSLILCSVPLCVRHLERTFVDIPPKNICRCFQLEKERILTPINLNNLQLCPC